MQQNTRTMGLEPCSKYGPEPEASTGGALYVFISLCKKEKKKKK